MRRNGCYKKCATCGERIYVQPYRAGTHRFCSTVCRARGQRGPSSNRYRHGKKCGAADPKLFSLAVKGEGCCRRCGAGGRLHLHHALPRSMYPAGRNEIRNGIPLCEPCHYGWHNRAVEIPRQVFGPDEWAYLTSADIPDGWLDRNYPLEALCN